MGKQNRKFFTHNSVVFVTSSVREGLPLVPTYVFNLILMGILAKGNSLYSGVRISHFMFMANHFHMILVVKKQEDVPAFVGYVKQEISHTINRLLGRGSKSIWCDGYDSPLVLTAEDVLRYITYLYFNPVKANLEDSVDEFPGVSSWKMFLSGKHSQICEHVKRAEVPYLGEGTIGINEQKRLVAELKNASEETCELVIDPFAWVECFEELKGADIASMQTKIIEQVRSAEETKRKERQANKQYFVGSTALRRQSILKTYESKRSGKRMICLCSDVKRRVSFISHFRNICAKADDVYQKWKAMDMSAKIPPGLFAPTLPLIVSALPICFAASS